MELARLVSAFEESATLALAAKAKLLAAEGKDIINMGAGEPDFAPPVEMLEEAASRLAKEGTRYTAVPGMPSLRKSLAKTLSADYAMEFSADEILVSNGGKQAIFHFLQAVLNPGDEVIIGSPYWVSFPEMVKIMGAKPVLVTGSRLLGAEGIASHLTPKTKLVILNSPSNPTGECYADEELKAVADRLSKANVWVLSDDTYYRMVYAPHRWSPLLKFAPELRSRLCIVGSSSKTYAMPGLRLGWAVGPVNLIKGMTKLQSQATSGASTYAQILTELFLTKNEGVARGFIEKFSKRREKMLAELKKVPGLSWRDPAGAFYVFVDCSERVSDVTAFASRLLLEGGVCTIPGVAFGDSKSLRFSYALDEAQISKGIERLASSLC